MSRAVPTATAAIEDVTRARATPHTTGSLAIRRLDAILSRALAAARTRYGDTDDADALRGLYVTGEQATAVLGGSAGVPLLSGADQPVQPGWDEICAGHPGWGWVRDTYGLTPRELDIVLIALAPEADLRYERTYAYLQDDVTRRRPTVDLVLDLLTTTTDEKLAGRAAFQPDGPLIDGRVVLLVGEQRPVRPPLLAHVVALDDQIVDVLLQQGGLDRRLASCCRLTLASQGSWDDVPLPAGVQESLRTAVGAAWGERPLRLYFHGPPRSGRHTTAEALARDLRVPVLTLDLTRSPVADGTHDAGAEAAEDVLARVFREARLQGALLLVDGVDALTGPQHAPGRDLLARHVAAHDGVVVLTGSRPWSPLGSLPLGVVSVSFERHGLAARRRTWERQLAAEGVSLEAGDLDALAGRFRLGPGQIREAVATALAAARWRGAGARQVAPTRDDLFAAARNQGGHDLTGLARRIEPLYSWDDLVLPDDSLTLLHELCQRVALRDRVLTDWGFERKLSQGRGTTALFAGPPGTGKTMAAEVVAAALGLDLFKVDLATVVSKYIGETEKNLERIFSAAEHSDAILLFDEADALFGRRSEVRDAHDRYANIETSYLLQRMEAQDGVAILATNQRQRLDDAFTRRLHVVVDFPFPDEAERLRIWQVCLPAEAPADPRLDLDRLARDFRLSGANIKNVALHAAFLAAAREERIGMGHLREAVRREYQKMGKVLADAELRPDAEEA